MCLSIRNPDTINTTDSNNNTVTDKTKWDSVNFYLKSWDNVLDLDFWDTKHLYPSKTPKDWCKKRLIDPEQTNAAVEDYGWDLMMVNYDKENKVLKADFKRPLILYSPNVANITVPNTYDFVFNYATYADSATETPVNNEYWGDTIDQF